MCVIMNSSSSTSKKSSDGPGRVQMSGAAKRKLKKQQEKSITKLRKLDDLGFINIVAPTNMSESSATTTVDQSGDRACNELNSSNPEGMIPLEAEALSLGSHAESGHEDNAYPGYPIEKCSSSECSSSKSSSSLLPEYSGDVALWKNISKEVREYWSMKGPKECQNYDGDCAASERQFKDQSRIFSKHLLFRKHLSGEEIAREWIFYSPSTGSIFCFICVLFGDKHMTTQFSGTGFSDWKHASSRLIDHENSTAHHSAQVAYSSLRHVCGRIDCEIGKQLEAEKRYWHDILKRVVAVIKFLSERGLPFRGDNEILNSPHIGIYLGCT